MQKTITFSSDLDGICHAENLLEEVSQKYHFGAEVYGNIMVSVVEAVSNAIEHGNNSDANKLVKLSCRFENEELSFSVEDEGEGFENDDLSDPTLPENLLNPYGRGIFLIKHLADDVKFHKNGKEIEMCFKIPKH